MKLVLAALLVLPMAALATDGPERTAQAYFDAIVKGDLDAASALFHAEATVFERGHDEGSWANYRSHHIGPELKAVERFELKPGRKEVLLADGGAMAMVNWVITYAVTTKKGDVHAREGTVSFVLLRSDQGWRIRHLHWSGRKPRKPKAH